MKVQTVGIYKFNVYEGDSLIANDMEFEVKKEGRPNVSSFNCKKNIWKRS